MVKLLPLHWILLGLLFACGSAGENAKEESEEIGMAFESIDLAKVTAVSISGSENAYTFQVTISSPDLGCNQYADWWEVIDMEGNLVYRRILAHSHVNEQPFTRSGGQVQISAGTKVYIRAHMNNSGYGINIFRGSVSDGFNAFELSSDFAKNLESEQPLPSGCAF
ncbi:hypothetical protein [Flagellimonas meridianipacifica]|uniref:Lipoprotein n=1 Tax=Flagellimonas meridianipacifica TaxID=1080225 RepID=A0A2T0MK18_9FLAO|nr:hypothetical protein [Allomuricauda pacifica]PRX57940.1 hypothetical protein CLV81_1954 [Allomuricauda pacifica]